MRSMDTPRARVPGVRKLPATLRPRVKATMVAESTSASPTWSPRVLTTMVCPLARAPGPWPVCTVVTPSPRSQATSGSPAL